MITNRDAISTLRSTHRLLSSDGVINDRTVLSVLRNNASVLIKRELNLRKLVATDTIYTTIHCLPLEAVPISKCCDYNSNKLIARSKIKLPRIGESNYFYSIKGVFGIEQNVKLKELTPSRYINLLSLRALITETYYWISDGYLYVTNPDVTTVKLVAFFEEDVTPEVMYQEDCDCDGKVDKKELCKNPLDNEFKCPSYLLQPVIEMSSAYLLKTYFRLPEDRQDDNVDGQSVNNIGK